MAFTHKMFRAQDVFTLRRISDFIVFDFVAFLASTSSPQELTGLVPFPRHSHMKYLPIS